MARDVAAFEQQRPEQSLRFILALACREPKPSDGLTWIARAAVAIEIKPSEIVLSLRIGKIGRSIPKQLARSIRIGLDRRIWDPLEVKLPERYKCVGHQTCLFC